MKYLFFGIIYFSIGVEFSVMLIILPIYLVEEGVSIQIATLVIGLGTLPWMIKFLWGGIVDYYIRYGRKYFILIGGILGSIGFIFAGFINPIVSLGLFVFVLFLSHVGTALIDVSIDAIAVEISTSNNRGKINGVMRWSNYIGMAIGIMGFGITASVFGYEYIFLIAGILLTISILFSSLISEPYQVKSYYSIYKVLINEFKKKTTQLVTILGSLSNITAGIITVIVPLYMKTVLELDIGMIGLVSMILPITIAVGSISGGILTDIWGRKKCLFLFLIPSVLVTVLFVFADTWQIAMVLYGLIGFFIGSYSTIIFTLFMDVTNPEVGATQFSVFTSISNFGELGAGALTGSLIVMFGFTKSFLYAAWVFGPLLLVLYFMRMKNDKG